MKTLGISAGFHDSAAALVVDGEVVAAASEERFSRHKHDAAIPVQAAAFCLEQAGLSSEDLDQVVFYEKPLRKFDRILSSGLAHFPASLPMLTSALRTWLTDRLWLRGRLCRELNVAPEQLRFCEHHLSHAASTFLTSTARRAAVITVDGVGEWTTTAIHHATTDGHRTQLTPLAELHYPHSIGLLYSAITAYLGFAVNDGEYKVMGLAAYGRPRFLDALGQMCTVNADASLELDLRYFAFHRHPTQSFAPAMEALLGPARRAGVALNAPPRTDEDQRFADVAASLQHFTQTYLLALARRAHKLTGEDTLCLAGGVALNCVANGVIAEQGPFAHVHVHPAAGDAGGALGAALWAQHVLHDVPRAPNSPSVFLGKSWEDKDVAQVLDDCHVPYQRFELQADLYAHAAQRLAGGQVGALCQGRFEWGPRALGARSIVADARVADMKERINRKIKFREGFRPFAPAVLQHQHNRFFEPGSGADAQPAQHMLTVRKVTDEGHALLPAITHVDGSARVQCVTKAQHPHMHALLSSFHHLTGVGALLNTSLNLKDEPPAASPLEAYTVFARSDLDFMVLGNCVLARSPA